MPSFLSKVFGRRKDDKDSSPSNQLGPGELLGGKFEAISPNVSPNAAHYLELQSDTIPAPDADSGRIINEEKDFGLPFFRIKSRPSSPEVKPKRFLGTLPPLSLDFDLKDKSAYNGFIFEESNPEAVFPDNVLGQRRLNPMEALILIRACSKAIISRGLETLGIMTPHWYSASPDVQRRLISNFLRSLDSTTSPAAAVPTSPYITNFEDEVNFTRSIHDVAAVLRWGLRHLQLEGDSFGTNDGWYKAFLDAEAANDYPPKAFSEILAPSLPASHLDVVLSILEVFSSLAAFSEANSTSGSRLSKIFGLWLLTARRVEDKDDWRTFYARWERTGRMLEHLFLARIRDQSTDQRLPTRLLDLVRKYPFTHGLSSPTTDLQLLPYPQFTTALHPALFVRIQYEVPSQDRIPKTKINPSVLLADTFSTKVEEGEFVELWAKITSAATKAGSELPLGNVLANESLRLLSLLADKPKEDVKSPALSVISLVEPQLQRAASNGAASFSLLKPNTESAPLTTTATLSPLGGDWEQFSASGFLGIDQTFPPLVSTLFDTDIEKTEPRDIPLPISRKSSKRAVRKSLELPRSAVIGESYANSSPNASNPNSSRQEVITASQFEVIELDEAFVDFWSDALLDPIASSWPTLFICKFKPSLVPDLTYGTGDETTKKTLKWLVLEQVYSVKPRPVPTSPLMTLPTSAGTSSPQPASPVAHTPTGRRLFNFWSMSRTPSSSSTGSQKTRKTPKTPKVGEMGELIEEDEPKVRSPTSKKFKSLDLGVKRLAGKKSYEKTKSIDVARPEISVTSPTDVDASIVAASAVAASGAAATTAVRLATEKQESDIINLSTVPEVATESKPFLVSESADDASKQDFIPVEAEELLAEVEKAGEETIHAAVPEQADNQIVVAAETAVASFPETTITADEPQAKELMKGEGGTTTEEDVSHHLQEVDQSFLISAAPTSAESSCNQPLLPDVELPVQQVGEVEQNVSVLSAIAESDKRLDELAVISEEHQVLPGEDERMEISEPSGKEPGTVAPALPEVGTQLAESGSKVDEEAHPVEVKKGESSRALPVAEGVGNETSVPTEPASIVEGPNEAPVVKALDDRDTSIEEASRPVAVASTEVVPSVEDAATKGIPPAVEELGADEAFVGGVPAPVDPSSAIVERVEEVLPAAEASKVIEAPAIDDTSAAAQAAEESPVSVPQEFSGPSLEVGGTTTEVSPVVEADVIIETTSEGVATGASAEQEIDESQAPEAPVETAVEEPSVDALIQQSSSSEPEPPVEIVTPQETTEKLPAESEILQQLTSEHTSRAEGSPNEEMSTATGEAVEERSQEARAVEPELTVEGAIEKSVEVPETQETSADEVIVSGGSPDSNDAARETVASEHVLRVEALESSSFAVKSGSEVPAAGPTSEESSEPPIITQVVSTAEEPSQEVPVLKEEIPTQLETDETPLVESQPPTEEPREEPVLETKLPEPELPIEEPETLLEDAPEVLQEPDATNEAVLDEDVPLAEAAALDDPEHESTSEVPDAGEASIPKEESTERAEEFLDPVLTTSEDGLGSIPVADPPIVEETPLAEEEPLADGEVTATSEGMAVETLLTATEGIEQTTEITAEINEGDSPPESVTASAPEVSDESPSIPEEAFLTAEEPVASIITEPALVEALLEVPEVVEDAPAIVEEVDDAANAGDVINVAEPPTVDEPALSADEAPEQDSFTPIVGTLSHEPVAKTSDQAIPEDTRTEDSPAPPHEVDNAGVSAAIEQPSTYEESLPNAADAEQNTSTSIPLEGVSPLVDQIPVPEEESPIVVEKTSEAVHPVPDAVEDVSVPVDEMPLDAEQTTVIVAESLDVGPQPDAETATEPETSSTASEQPAEQGDNISAIPAPVEVSTDIDQPILSQEVAAEGGIILEPTTESAARDDSFLEKPDGPTIPVTTSTPDLPNEPAEEEPAADGTASPLDPTIATSISEKGPMETPTPNSPPSIICPSNVAELDISPVQEPSPDLATEQSEDPTEGTGDLPAIPEYIHVAPIDANQPGILAVPVVEESRAVTNEETTVAQLEEPESAGGLWNGVDHIKTATEATDTTIVALPDGDLDVKIVVDESAASEPLEVNTTPEKLTNEGDSSDIETTQEVGAIAIAETP